MQAFLNLGCEGACKQVANLVCPDVAAEIKDPQFKVKSSDNTTITVVISGNIDLKLGTLPIGTILLQPFDLKFNTPTSFGTLANSIFSALSIDNISHVIQALFTPENAKVFAKFLVLVGAVKLGPEAVCRGLCHLKDNLVDAAKEALLDIGSKVAAGALSPEAAGTVALLAAANGFLNSPTSPPQTQLPFDSRLLAISGLSVAVTSDKKIKFNWNYYDPALRGGTLSFIIDLMGQQFTASAPPYELPIKADWIGKAATNASITEHYTLNGKDYYGKASPVKVEFPLTSPQGLQVQFDWSTGKLACSWQSNNQASGYELELINTMYPQNPILPNRTDSPQSTGSFQLYNWNNTGILLADKVNLNATYQVRVAAQSATSATLNSDFALSATIDLATQIKAGLNSQMIVVASKNLLEAIDHLEKLTSLLAKFGEFKKSGLQLSGSDLDIVTSSINQRKKELDSWLSTPLKAELQNGLGGKIFLSWNDCKAEPVPAPGSIKFLLKINDGNALPFDRTNLNYSIDSTTLAALAGTKVHISLQTVCTWQGKTYSGPLTIQEIQLPLKSLKVNTTLDYVGGIVYISWDVPPLPENFHIAKFSIKIIDDSTGATVYPDEIPETPTAPKRNYSKNVCDSKGNIQAPFNADTKYRVALNMVMSDPSMESEWGNSQAFSIGALAFVIKENSLYQSLPSRIDTLDGALAYKNAGQAILDDIKKAKEKSGFLNADAANAIANTEYLIGQMIAICNRTILEKLAAPNIELSISMQDDDSLSANVSIADVLAALPKQLLDKITVQYTIDAKVQTKAYQERNFTVNNINQQPGETFGVGATFIYSNETTKETGTSGAARIIIPTYHDLFLNRLKRNLSAETITDISVLSDKYLIQYSNNAQYQLALPIDVFISALRDELLKRFTRDQMVPKFLTSTFDANYIWCRVSYYLQQMKSSSDTNDKKACNVLQSIVTEYFDQNWYAKKPQDAVSAANYLLPDQDWDVFKRSAQIEVIVCLALMRIQQYAFYSPKDIQNGFVLFYFTILPRFANTDTASNVYGNVMGKVFRGHDTEVQNLVCDYVENNYFNAQDPVKQNQYTRATPLNTLTGYYIANNNYIKTLTQLFGTNQARVNAVINDINRSNALLLVYIKSHLQVHTISQVVSYAPGSDPTAMITVRWDDYKDNDLGEGTIHYTAQVGDKTLAIERTHCQYIFQNVEKKQTYTVTLQCVYKLGDTEFKGDPIGFAASLQASIIHFRAINLDWLTGTLTVNWVIDKHAPSYRVMVFSDESLKTRVSNEVISGGSEFNYGLAYPFKMYSIASPPLTTTVYNYDAHFVIKVFALDDAGNATDMETSNPYILINELRQTIQDYLQKLPGATSPLIADLYKEWQQANMLEKQIASLNDPHLNPRLTREITMINERVDLFRNTMIRLLEIEEFTITYKAAGAHSPTDIFEMIWSDCKAEANPTMGEILFSMNYSNTYNIKLPAYPDQNDLLFSRSMNRNNQNKITNDFRLINDAREQQEKGVWTFNLCAQYSVDGIVFKGHVISYDLDFNTNTK